MFLAVDQSTLSLDPLGAPAQPLQGRAYVGGAGQAVEPLPERAISAPRVTNQEVEECRRLYRSGRETGRGPGEGG